MNVKLIIAYDGTNYLGWQKTRMGPSIEETLEKALSQILQEPIALQAASRTDRGVHAAGQVVNFFLNKSELDLQKLQRGLNGILPRDVSIISMEQMSDDFHPTLDTAGKEYHYSLCLGAVQSPFYQLFSWHIHSELNISAMELAALQLIGRHDFSAFANQKVEDGLCELTQIKLLPLPDDRLRIVVSGNRFLYKMVRNIVGTLIYVGQGKLDLDTMRKGFVNKDRTLLGITAPAHGLCLHQVAYACKELSLV
jgi:tRNA pseudouridine38-40 synthase